jgi:1-acyl-sn-glycerol-3-phosphate acyltransferase
MPDAWYRWFHRWCNAVYFARVSVLHAERLPVSGPVLYLGLHRNGAVDGFIYHGVLPRAVFMLAAQLRRNAFGRLFFTGIEVVREKDRGAARADDASNTDALRRCLDHLATGGELFILPEGTSSLGPRHLPFQSGGARILADHLATGCAITVVPLGIHYDCAWGFRSKVEVVAGEPISTALPAGASAFERLKELRRRIQTALEGVGVNVESAERLRTIEQLAYIATLGTARSYFSALKSLEQHIPAPIATAWHTLEAECAGRRLWRHQGVPLFPIRPPWLYVGAFAVVTPFMLVAIAVNAPPFLAAAWAGKKLPDDRNVISLWRILVGMPAFLLWIAVVALGLCVTNHPAWLVAYAVLTFGGLRLYRTAQKIAVAAHNAVFHADLRPRALAFHRFMQEALPDA